MGIKSIADDIDEETRISAKVIADDSEIQDEILEDIELFINVLKEKYGKEN